jgi:O-Antigen ligase
MQRVAWIFALVWIATAGVQVEVKDGVHIGLSEVLAVPMFLSVLPWAISNPLTPLVKRLLVFTGLFLSLGNLMAALQLGYISRWAFVQKDLGIVEMVVCVFALSAVIDSRSRLKTALQVFLISGSLLNLLGFMLMALWATTGYGSFVMYFGVRYQGFMPNPNAWAPYLLSIAMVQLCWLWLKNSRYRLLQWANFALLAAGTVLSGSRIGLIILAVGPLMVALAAKERIRALFSYATVSSLVFVALWQAGVIAMIQNRVVNGETDSRIEMHVVGFRMYSESPLTMITGIGIGTFLAKAQDNMMFEQQIHDTFAWLLVEGGPGLLLLFLWILAAAIIPTWRHRRTVAIAVESYAIFVCLIILLLCFLTIDGLYQHEFWLFLVLPSALAAKGVNEHEASPARFRLRGRLELRTAPSGAD